MCMRSSKISDKTQKPVNTTDRKEKTVYNQRKAIGVMNIVLIIIGITTAVFVSVMIWLYYLFQSVPDSLIAAYFAFVGGECGVMGWIKNVKEKKQDRQWAKEDKADNAHNDG